MASAPHAAPDALKAAADAVAAGESGGLDYAALYDAHPDYDARRRSGSFAQAQIDLEVRDFKLPHLLALLHGEPPARRVCEIGCATGELIAAFPVAPGGERVGLDISPRNIAAASERFDAARFAGLRFIAGDFRSVALPAFDLVILSDVLEHVEDDAAFLRDAAQRGARVLINLPLECNWLNRRRAYGPADVSGHLRAYTLAQGLQLVASAGLQVQRWSRVWIHETSVEAKRRALRARHEGHAYSGAWPLRAAKRALFCAAAALPPLGRRLFASNLFVLARPAPLPPAHGA